MSRLANDSVVQDEDELEWGRASMIWELPESYPSLAKFKEAISREGHPYSALPNNEFQRLPELTKAYDRYRAELQKLCYASTSDSLKQTILNFSTEKNSEGKLVAVKGFNSLEFKLTKNRFPYLLKEGLSHAVLWSHNPWDIETAREKVAELVAPCDFAIWVNEVSYRSVPGLWHTQVIYEGVPDIELR